MLLSLHIKDFAIIDELEMALGPGLNVMTGETGAGKTIIAQALGLVLGERASIDVIRAEKETATVSAAFDTAGIADALRESLAEAGIEAGEEVIVHRVVAEGGKGRITVNGVPVTGAMLKGFAEQLVDISSQHEHQLLLDPAQHAAIVDAYGDLEKGVARYRDLHTRWATAARALADLREGERTAKERLDFLTFQLQELTSANLAVGEDAALEALRNRLKHAVALEERARSAEGALYGDAGSALETIERAAQLVAQCAQIDPAAAAWGESLGRARAEVEEVARELARYAEKLESNPERLEETDERLHLIRGLLRKHGGSIEACLARREEIQRDVGTIVRYDEIVEEKSRALDAVAAERRAAAFALSGARKKSALRLGQAVAAELAGLGMAKAGFVARVEQKPEGEWDEAGPDRIEFLIAPNVGEPLRPLARIASGGELSRVMLAVKGALSDRARLAATSVFDEVDAGIGGAIAEVVGKKLKEVARSRQVVCITHLPQVAVHGDRHLRISKRVEGGRTVAILEALSKEDRVEEIARMLGGQKITKATVAHAREMLASAQQDNIG